LQATSETGGETSEPRAIPMAGAAPAASIAVPAVKSFDAPPASATPTKTAPGPALMDTTNAPTPASSRSSRAAAARAPMSAPPKTPSQSATSEQQELSDLQKMLSGGNSERRTPPTRAEIMAMPVHAAVNAMERFVDNKLVVDAVLDRFKGLSYGPQRRQAAVDAGVLPAIVNAMKTHADLPAIQESSCLALGNLAAGVDEAGVARKQAAAEAGALEAVANAMQSYVDVEGVVEYGCFAIGNICYAADELGLQRKQRAADACAISAILAAMRSHSGDASIAEYGCFAIGNVCRAVGGRSDGTDELGKQRKESAVDAGGLGVIVNAMRFHEKEKGVHQWGSRALSNITYGNNEWRTLARQAGARPNWLVGLAEAEEIIERSRDSPSTSKTERLAIKAPGPRMANTMRAPQKRAPRIPSKEVQKMVNSAGSPGKMVALPSAGPLWRDR
jgi:hypothetical protein